MAAGFDVDAWRAHREPWTLRIGGRAVVARPVSALAVAAFLDGLGALDWKGQAKRARALWRAAFPWRWWYWPFPAADPVRLIMALEPVLYRTVLDDFLAYLGSDQPQAAPPAATATPGTLSTGGTSSPI